MKALKLFHPAGLDQLRLVELPDPGQPGAGEIRVRIHASSINFHDYGVVSGRLKAEDGRIPLADGAGVVEAVGAGVVEFAAGDKVVSCFFPHWHDGPAAFFNFATTPGDGVDGFAREVVVASATAFTHAPRGYSHAEAATLTTAGLTAWRALVVEGGLKAGDTVLTLGTGGVSIFALQFAKAMGARVISTSSSNEKLARLRDMGADHTLNYREQPNWGEAVRDLTDGRGVDHVLEVVGPATLAQSALAVRGGGQIYLIGALQGAAGELPTFSLLLKQVRLQGILVGSRRHQQDMVRAIDAIALRPVIDQTFPLASLADAFRHETSGAHFGKICIEI
jgi:NADPH:quinone reductase-like Zn-dependent oxidoreductase